MSSLRNDPVATCSSFIFFCGSEKIRSSHWRPSPDEKDETKIAGKHLAMVHDVAAFGIYLLTCDMDRVFFLVHPIIRDF